MDFSIIFEILKYIDCFGTKFTFYTERSRKLYTSFGGILTLFSIFFGLITFIYITLDDFLHNNPNSTTSTKREKYRKIKFKEEKIWIPWRIRDFGGKTVNHKDLLYPIIFYYKGIRNNSLEKLEVTYDFVDYKLCNETSMINNSDLYMIDIDIGQLYCIDMEDLDIGGSWDSNFLDLITFDLYICKNGINYDEENINCTTYEKIIEAAGTNDCFEFEMYYPVVQYQPINKTKPIFIRYYNYFYHLSRYSNKIDRLYLQQHIFKDDVGWIYKDEKSSSHWGTISLNGDSYATGDKKDLMNEGSTSRLYSFNIYLKSDIIFYHRSYKKLLLIFADGLPIINIIFIFFGIIGRVFKISSGNKKLTELLFENLKTKKMKVNNEQFNSILNKQKNEIQKDNNNKSRNTLQMNLNNNSINKNLHDISSFHLNKQESGKKIIQYNDNNHKPINNKNSKPKMLMNRNSNIAINTNCNKSYHKSLRNSVDSDINNGSIGNVKLNNKIEDLFSIKSNNLSSNLNFSNNIKHKKNNSDRSIEYSIRKYKLKEKYVKKTLFPYRYYICSIFIKNINIYKNNFFFTKKFIVVYNFICQLFDISSYLILQKEFEIMKNSLLVEKYKEILENRKKINVNDLNFNMNMKECLDAKKFSILGKIN